MFKAVALALVLAAPLTIPGMTQAQGFRASDQEVSAFVAADANADGLLTLAEFRVFVRAMAGAGQPTAQTIRTFGAYRYAFGVVDRNRDNRASPEELRAADTDFQAQE